MIGNSDWFSDIFASVPDGSISEWNRRIAIAMIRHGLAVVLCKPGSKEPACTLNTTERKQADATAQHNARERGLANWENARHPCGRDHAIINEKVLTKAAVKRLLETGANLAIAPGRSEARVFAIDVDTSEEHNAFVTDWINHASEDVPLMTVASPGVFRDQTWVHKDGGHYWLTFPDDFDLARLPRAGKYRSPHGWVAYWDHCYLLVPPSVRPEGAYRATGSAVEAPAWLLDTITSGPAAKDSAGHLGAFSDDPVDTWSREHEWEEILEQDGYMPSGRFDTCGCPTYTRPGYPTHAKSVTGHEPELCTRYTGDQGHCPAHVWSDAVGGEWTGSKLSWIVKFRFDGDTSAAMTELGIVRRFADNAELMFADPKTDGGNRDIDGDPTVSERAPDTVEDPTAGDDVSDSWARKDLTRYVSGDIEQIRPELMPREDGQHLLYTGKIHSFHGEPESGKSLILQWEACRLIMKGYDVLYLAFDSDPDEDIPRIMRMGASAQAVLTHLDYRNPEDKPAQHSGGFPDMFTRPYRLVVWDGVTDGLGLFGGKTNEGDDIAHMARIAFRRLARTGASVALIDHVSKDKDTRGRYAIGSQSKMAMISGAAYVVDVIEPFGRNQVGKVALRIGKDRPGSIRPQSLRDAQTVHDRTQLTAEIVIDDTGPNLTMSLGLPAMSDPFNPQDLRPRPEVLVRVSTALAEYSDGLTGRQLRASLKGTRAADVDLAVAWLTSNGYLRMESGPRNANIHVLQQPWTPELESGQE